MLVDDALEFLGVGEFGDELVLQVHLDVGAAGDGGGLVAGQFADGVGTLAVTGPLHGGRALAVAPGEDAHAVGDHVHGVESHAEAADDAVGVVAAGLLQRLEKAGGAGVGDGADVLHELGLGHADAIVGDGEGLLVLVGLDADFQRRVVAGVLVGGLDAQLVQRVRGVGDEFAQEDLVLGVQRVDEDFEELFDFGFEFVGGLSCHWRFLLGDWSAARGDVGEISAPSSHKAPLLGAGPWRG